MDYFSEVCLLTVFENFVYDKAYFKLCPVFKMEVKCLM